MGCSIWRWYEGEGKREKPFAINSVVEGSITLIKLPKNGKKEEGEYKARIITYELEKRQKYFECAVDDYARQVLEKEAEYQPKGKTQHYGLIIVRPGRPNLVDSMVMDFISFHRHPVVDTEKPTTSRYGISAYNEVFETRALKELALKDAQRSKRTIEDTISQIIDVNAGVLK
ncbi:MAG: hypothetical protein H8K07_01950 [Nitrospira sp.]|nr:hypothetical protein [Nitrospira sp.]